MMAAIPSVYTVVVVDNASSDETCDYIKKNYPKVILLQQSENLGFGQANNKGIALALQKGATAVFLLNQDVYLEKDTIAVLEKYSQKYPEYGILSPLHYDGTGAQLDRNFSVYLSYDKQPQFYADAIQAKLKEIYPVPFVNAAAWYIPKKTLEIVGGFDPIFFHYCEDDNFVQRNLYHQLKVGIVPSVQIYHDRENRKTVVPSLFSDAYFKERENALKKRLANPHFKDTQNQIHRHRKQLQKNIIKSILSLNWKMAKGYSKERVYVAVWAKEIMHSRSITITTGKHYL
jgi:GT2 family glycosyltransferase